MRVALDGGERVEGQAGGVDADFFARGIGSDPVADEREYERLRDAHDRERVVPISRCVDGAVRPDDAEAEAVGGRAGEGGIDVGDGAVHVGAEALVGLLDQGGNGLGRRQPAGRDKAVLRRRRQDFAPATVTSTNSPSASSAAPT